MSLQGNGRNHNIKPDLSKEENFIKNDVISESVNNEQHQPTNDSEKSKFYPVDIAYISPEEKKERIRQSSTNKISSAYDDLDDYVYKHDRKRRRRRTSIGRRIEKMFGGYENKHSHKKKMKTWKKVLISVICVLLALIIGLVATIVILDNKGKEQLLKNDNVKINVPDKVEKTEDGMYITTEDGKKYRYNENITTVLCMGVDKEELENVEVISTGGSADALFLITIDTATGATNMINISRDTIADIGVYSTEGSYVGTEKSQICLAYSYGDGRHTSCENQVRAVSQLFYNIPINSYLSLDLGGVGAINDSMGGITVVSPETIDPFVAGETYTLYGDDAETFVRKRTLEVVEGNSLRMQRQKVYLESFVQELIEKTKADIQTPLKLYETATPYICTNLDASKITYLGLNALRGQYSDFQVQSLEGEIKQGEIYAEFYVDEDKLFELFLDIFYEPVI